MILGVNFRHDPKVPIGFDATAVRNLRPAIVRHVLDKPEQIGAWIEAARKSRLQIVWGFLPEIHGVRATEIAAEFLIRTGLDVTAGVELGAGSAWPMGTNAAEYLGSCLELAERFRRLEVLESVVDRGRAVHVTTRPAFGAHRPVILQTGYVAGSGGSFVFLSHVLRLAAQHGLLGLMRSRFHAFAVAAVCPGRPWPRFSLRGFQASIMDRLGLPLSVLRAGWREGATLRRRTVAAESIRAWHRGAGWRWVPKLEADARRRWYLEAFEQAERLGAVHFLAESELTAAGVNGWGLYRSDAAIADPIWYALQWKTIRGRGPVIE